MRLRLRAVATTAAALCVSAGAVPVAGADVFNGRIGFTSFRVDHDPGPGELHDGDIFTMTPGGTDVRQLTDDPAYDAQTDWSPDGRVIGYRIRKPDHRVNFEVARMPAGGGERTILTSTPEGEASSMPSWFPDGTGLLFRRSGRGLVADVWAMGTLGEDPHLLFPLEGSQWYPSFSPDMSRLVFATTLSPRGDTDRGIFTSNPDGTGLETVFNVPGVMDTAPAWSPDGEWIAFESDADIDGGNPEGDREIFLIHPDGTGLRQLTRNTDHDEGPAFSPDGTMIAYSGGPDELHGDIHVMTPAGVHVAQLTTYSGRDESPDWQPIPAPATDRRCGDIQALGVRDVRSSGRRERCGTARRLARLWVRDRRWQLSRLGYRAEAEDFGGTQRIVLRHRHAWPRRERLVAFLAEPTR